MTCTFFDAFNVPVFWPILVMYFIMLFCITMKRQIKVRTPDLEPNLHCHTLQSCEYLCYPEMNLMGFFLFINMPSVGLLLLYFPGCDSLVCMYSNEAAEVVG